MSESTKTILLTGATGFLGSHLLRRLLEDNHNIVAIKRSSSDTWRIQKLMGHSNQKFYDIDMIDPSVIFEENSIDVIIHTATEYGRTNKSVSKMLEPNLILPIRLAELGIEYGAEYFINTDTFSNKADNSYSVRLNYLLSKKTMLLWLKQLSEQIRVINIVLEHVYGQYDNEFKFVETLIQDIAVKRLPRIALTPGYQKRDFVYIEDVLDAYMCILKNGLKNDLLFQEFEVGTGSSAQVRELAEIIKKASGSQTALGFGDISYQKNELMESKAETSRLKDLCWAPKFSIKEGIICILKTYEIQVKG